MNFPTLFILGLVAHLIADWFFQNAWMAENKSNVRHPAGYVHAAVHMALMLPFFWIGGAPLLASAVTALVLGALHFAIDLRTALTWWRNYIGQTTDPKNPFTIHIAIWQDQAAHIALIALAAAALVRCGS